MTSFDSILAAAGVLAVSSLLKDAEGISNVIFQVEMLIFVCMVSSRGRMKKDVELAR